MQVLYTRCAGLDVHKDTIVACVRCVSPPRLRLRLRWALHRSPSKTARVSRSKVACAIA